MVRRVISYIENICFEGNIQKFVILYVIISFINLGIALGSRDTHNHSRVHLGNSNDIETVAQDAVLRQQVYAFICPFTFLLSFFIIVFMLC